MNRIRYRNLFFAGLLAAVIYAETPRPIVTEHGTFTLIDFPDSISTQIWAINSRGEMAGVYTSADRVTHGFLYSRGRFTTIDYPGAALTLANNLNANGDIVGEYAMTPTGPHHGFLLSGGRFTTVDFPGSASSAVVGIAANGDMIGIYDNPARAFLVSGDQFINIDVPGAVVTVLGSMSPQGDIIGSSSTAGISRAFLRRKGEIVATWEYPGAAGFTNAIGINAAGDIVGRYLDAARVSQGYVLSNGQFTSFACPGATFTGAAGITPEGDIVGRCTISGVTHGFLLKRGRQPRYRVTDLGTLGGNASVAYGISNAGVISGGASVANGDQHPFLWRDGKMTDLGGLGGGNGVGSIPTGSLQMAIAAEVAKVDPFGADFCGYGTHRVCVAATWREGKYTQVPTLGGNNAIGYAMNERGQMVGVAEKATPDPQCKAPQRLAFSPVIWGPTGEVQELPLPAGDTVGWAILINDKGEAIGSTGTCDNTATSVNGLLIGRRAVLWEKGVPRDLGSFGGEVDTVAVGINNRTEVVGGSALANGTYHGFLWSRENGMEDIGAIGDDAVGAPSSINNSRQVTGASCDAEFNCRAILWERYSMTDLNDLVPEDSPIYMVFGTWINDVGEIVGWGIDKKTEQMRAFVARPAQPLVSDAAKTTSARRVLPVSVRSRLQQRLPTLRSGHGLSAQR